MTLVRFSRARRRPDPARVQDFAATARKLQSERDAAADVVARALRDTPRSEWMRLADRADLRSVGVLERLGHEIDSRLDHEPAEALIIADLAIAIASTLPRASYPPVIIAQVSAHASKDRAQVLRYLARYEEALTALDDADSRLEHFGTLGHDLAIIRFVRAMALQEVDRFDESLRLLNECSAVFRSHGDARRLLQCGIVHGMLLHRLKRFLEAREVGLRLLEVARELDDESVAIIQNNLAYTCIELSQFDAAERHLSAAVEILRKLDQPVRIAMVELAWGRLMVRRGSAERGIAHLRRVRSDLARRGVVEEAGIAGLDIVEALLAVEKAAEAETLARDIIGEFTAARLSSRAISALGFLREAIEARRATGATVDHVRDYITSLRKHPERVFVATA